MNPESNYRRIAVIGAGGQLGRSLVDLLEERAVPLTHSVIDITDEESIQASFEAHQPDLVVNCAAYNFVDKAEDEPDQAFAVNAFGPLKLAKACHQRDVPLVHISSDYVFGDTGKLSETANKPRDEFSHPGPNSVYSASKLTGEMFVRTYCEKSFIIRTSGLYGPTPQKGQGNFVQTMLRLATSRDEVRVVNDQHCTPTSTADLAKAIEELSKTQAWGLYHITNAGQTTWYDFAREIFEAAELPTEVVPISSEEFGAAAKRPDWSVLDCAKFASVTGEKMPDWQDALRRYLEHR